MLHDRVGKVFISYFPRRKFDVNNFKIIQNLFCILTLAGQKDSLSLNLNLKPTVFLCVLVPFYWLLPKPKLYCNG